MLGSNLHETPNNYIYVKRLVITPTRFIYFEDVLMQKSRLLRMFPQHDFVIVAFRDENLYSNKKLVNIVNLKINMFH